MGLHWCIGAYIAYVQITQTFKALLVQNDLRRIKDEQGQLQLVGDFPQHLWMHFKRSLSSIAPQPRSQFRNCGGLGAGTRRWLVRTGHCGEQHFHGVAVHRQLRDAIADCRLHVQCGGWSCIQCSGIVSVPHGWRSQRVAGGAVPPAKATGRLDACAWDRAISHDYSRRNTQARHQSSVLRGDGAR